MGTKGQKNTPITARVNAGLFNQKKGITEPLLNVGPAGVYGDNQTKDIPSPSKKRGYSMAKKKIDSPIKQVNTNVITLGEGTEGTKGTEETKVKKPYVGAANDACSAEYIAANGSGACDKYKALSQEKKDAANFDIVPGNKGSDPVEGADEVDSIPLQTRDTNDAMSPWRVRQQSRSIKKSARDIRRSKIKSAKLDASGGGKIDEDGNFQETDKLKGKDRRKAVRDARKKAKVEENYMEKDAFDKNMTARTRQVEMSSDPLGKTGTFKSADRDFTSGEMDTSIGGEQDKRNEAQIKANKIKEAAAKAAAIAKAAEDAKTKAAGNTSPAMKTANSFFKSRSPMKKNYFK
jgi:hypothetical protein